MTSAEGGQLEKSGTRCHRADALQIIKQERGFWGVGGMMEAH